MEDSHNGHAHEKAVVHNPDGAPSEQIETAMDSCPAACIYWV
jgi:ferredoxin